MNIPVSEAKAKFSEILRRAAAGEEIVVTKNGKPFAKITDAGEDKAALIAKRKAFIGSLKGKGFWIANDFDEPLEDFAEYM